MSYAKEIKDVIIKEYKEGQTVSLLCDKYGISKSSLYKWLREYKILFQNKNITYLDYYKLKRQLEKARLELEIYEELHCFKDSTTKEKEIAISKYIGKYPIKTMCRLLDIPTGTVYNYHFRRASVTKSQIRDEQLKQESYRIFKESDERFGAKKIWIKLSTEGIKTTLGKVQKLMKFLNL